MDIKRTRPSVSGDGWLELTNIHDAILLSRDRPEVTRPLCNLELTFEWWKPSDLAEMSRRKYFLRSSVSLGSLSNDSHGNENSRNAISLEIAKQQLCTFVTLFCTFLCRRYATTTWKCLISRWAEDGNTRQSLSLSQFSLILIQSPGAPNEDIVQNHLT